MTFSLDKCCVLYLRLVDPAVSFSLGGVNLRCVSSCRDLRVNIAICLPLYIYMILLPKLTNDPTPFTVASFSEMLVY